MQRPCLAGFLGYVVWHAAPFVRTHNVAAVAAAAATPCGLHGGRRKGLAAPVRIHSCVIYDQRQAGPWDVALQAWTPIRCGMFGGRFLVIGRRVPSGYGMVQRQRNAQP